MTDVKQWIKSCEGIKLKPYKDTAGKWTIGYGRNIEDNGISVEEADMMFDNDFERCQKELGQFTWYITQPQNVKDALTNMCFNLGLSRLRGFRRMIAALISKDYTKAAMEIMDSEWCAQVPSRAKDVAVMVRETAIGST